MRARAKMVLRRDDEKLTCFVPSPEVVPLLCFVQGTMKFTIYARKNLASSHTEAKNHPQRNQIDVNILFWV